MAFSRYSVLLLSALLAGPAFFPAHPTRADELPFSHYTTERSSPRLPSTSIQNVHQDRFGFLWLATFSTGVARYDGERMESFGLADGVIDPTVREIVEDTAGRLWLGGEAGLMVTERPLDDPTRRPVFVTRIGGTDLPRTRVRHHWLRADPTGGVWLGTAGSGVLHLDIENGELHTRQVLLESGMDVQPQISGLVVRADGTVWAGLGTGSVVSFASDEADPDVHTLDFEAVPSSPLGAFAERDGTLWAGAFDGTLWRFDDDSNRFVQLPVALGETVKALYVAPDGVVWAGSLGGGLVRFDPATGVGRTLTRADGLLSETLWDLEVDREGTLWLAHNAGLSKLRSDYRAFRHLTGRGRTPTLPEPTVFGVLAPGDDGLIWVGTGGGLTALDAADQTLSNRAILTTDDGLSSGSVYSMERDGSGRLWLGTAAGLDILSFGGKLPSALVSADTHDVEVLGREGQLGSYGFSTTYSVRTLTLHGGGKAMCVAGVDGLACRTAGSWKIFGPLAGVPASGATAMAVDSAGRLWVGTKEDGALRTSVPVTPDALQEWTGGGPVVTQKIFEPGWTRAQGAMSDSVRSLAVTGDEIWIAHAAGLDAMRHQDGEIVSRHFGSSEGLGGDHVVALEPTPDGRRLWVAAGAGLTELRADDGQVLRRVTREQGLLDNEAWVSHSLRVGADDKVYFGTPRGITIYDPKRHHEPDPVATPQMRRVHVVSGEHGNNRVELSWAAATYLDEEDVRYSTRLLGLDDEWSEPSTRAEATYTHLPVGDAPQSYTFQVRTSPTPGVWLDEILVQEIVVEP